MNLRSLSTRLFILCSILCAFAFAGGDDDFDFYLSSGQIYTPGDAETSIEFSGNAASASTVYLRAFRIDDPVEFFLAQKDPHSPSLVALKPPNTFDMISMGYRRATRDARYAARDVMPEDARRAIRDVSDLNGTKSPKPTEKTTTQTQKNPLPTDDIPKGAEEYKIVSSWEHKLPPKAKDDWYYEKIPVPVREKGVYLIEARVRGKRAITALIISEYGMVVKEAKDEMLAFVVNSNTGEKVEGFPLTITRGGEKVAEKETGGDGIMRTSIAPLPEMKAPEGEGGEEDFDWRWNYRRRQKMVVGEKDGNFIISDPYYYSEGDRNSSRIYLHTDRPVYRPAHTVYYRGIARTVNDDGTYAKPNGLDTVLLAIENSRGEVIRRDTMRLSDVGTFSGQLALGEDMPLGTYSIKTWRKGTSSENDTQWFNFEVEEYKKPEYKVEVMTDRTQYTRGDSLVATAKASYYFGSPVANADVEYFVYRARYWRPWWQGSDWAYLYEDSDDDFSTYRMEMVSSGKGKLESNGTYRVAYRTDPAADRDYVYRVQVNVVDNSRRSIAGAKSVEVTRGEFYISSRLDRYVYKPGDDARLGVEIRTFDGDKPVAIPFTVRVVRTWWEKGKVTDSTMTPEYTKKTETIWTGNGSTDGSGKGSASYKTTQAGYFEVEIAANDKRGTRIVESNYIYVASESYANWYRQGSGDVQIIPDKEGYRPGETMDALIVMPASNLDVLVTVEGSKIFKHQVERLNATSAIVHIPIEERYAPAVYLDVAAIVNGQMYSESRRITVVPEGKLLRLEVKSDKEIYRPGESGTMMVRAVDEGGSPVSGVDVAVGMVDESIYAIRPDATPDIQRFFYGGRWNSVETSSSLNFSFYGNARRIDPDATDALYGAAGSRSPDRFARLARPGDRAAMRAVSYGDIKGEMFVQPVTRKNFKDMMFWTPSARTGADGWVKLNVDFPDNLTTWRITARAVGPNTSVGQTVSRVVARKELMVRMETPRFMIQGDELLIATTVHNYLKGEKTAKVEFSGENVSGENVSLISREQTITLPANGEKRIDWRVTAPKSGKMTMRVKALTNEESDAMELVVPVLPRGMKLATGGGADLSGAQTTGTIPLVLPEGADPSTGEVWVTLSPSIAGSMLGALDSLIGYPYGCVEQTMSRFLPTVVIADVLKKLDLPFDEKRRAEIPKMVAKGTSTLYSMQHDDGGWGWWENDKTVPFMTAYVVYGLTVAKRAGYDVTEERYNSGVSALKTLIESGTSPDGSKLDATSDAYMLYVMSFVNQRQPQKYLVDKIRSLSRRDTINDYARALLALAANYQEMRSDAQSLAAKLESHAKVTDTYASWAGRSFYYTWQNDEVETSAFAVKALLDVKGESDLVRKGIRWLLAQKDGDSWHNTRQTAMTIYALVDYVKASGESTPNYTAIVKVNGQEVYSKKMSQEDIYRPETRVKLEGISLKSGNNQITVEKRGEGRLYSAARLIYYATGNALKASNAGFKVTREYYTLRKERSGDIYVYTKQPFTGTVKTGDEIFVKVKITPDATYEYFMLEDPLPAGCEVVDNTNGYTIPGERDYDEAERQKRGYWGWHWWYSDREVRDEKMAFFSRYMPAQPHEFSYILRAQIPGSYAVMPSVGSLMYYPEVRGNSDLIAMKITE